MDINQQIQPIIALIGGHVYAFMAVFGISVALNVMFMIVISVRQKKLMQSSVPVTNIKMFSPNISERFRRIFFLLNIFDYGSKDFLFKFYVLLWRISGFVAIACFVIFLMGEH